MRAQKVWCIMHHLAMIIFKQIWDYMQLNLVAQATTITQSDPLHSPLQRVQ